MAGFFWEISNSLKTSGIKFENVLFMLQLFMGFYQNLEQKIKQKSIKKSFE